MSDAFSFIFASGGRMTFTFVLFEALTLIGLIKYSAACAKISSWVWSWFWSGESGRHAWQVGHTLNILPAWVIDPLKASFDTSIGSKVRIWPQITIESNKGLKHLEPPAVYFPVQRVNILELATWETLILGLLELGQCRSWQVRLICLQRGLLGVHQCLVPKKHFCVQDHFQKAC